MQMSGGHLLAAGLDGGNSMIFTKGENAIKSRLADASSVLDVHKENHIRQDVLFLFVEYDFAEGETVIKYCLTMIYLSCSVFTKNKGNSFRREERP